MHLEFANIPNFEPKELTLPGAEFLSYKPDFNQMKQVWKDYGIFNNFVVLGNGGSINSLIGIWGALGGSSHKNIYTISTIDPDYIYELKHKLAPHDTLVIAASKSGDTITVLEALMQFDGYPWIAITEKDTTLAKIAEKEKAQVITHPAIGGRYAGLTEVALIPAMLGGLDVEAIWKGAQRMHDMYNKDNIALKAAQIMYELEQGGYIDVFMPIYSHHLFPLSNLIVQLCHESFGKDSQGQTYFAHEAPESQHHTNQRFFGGRKNVAGLFIRAEHFHHDTATDVPAGLHSIPLKSGSLYDLHKMPLAYALESEFEGTWEETKINSIPAIAIGVNGVTPEEIGQFIAFWQLYAVYSSILRKVNPFDQPQVENSKQISWNKRLDFKR